MVVALVTLVVLMIGAVALIRSMSASMSIAGAFGIKRDMANQAANALAQVRTAMTTGALASDTARGADNLAANYFASIQPTTAEGIPTRLIVSDTDFTSAGFTTPPTVNGITVRYLVDRLCSSTGPASSGNCMIGSTPVPLGASAGDLKGGGNASGAIVPQAVYRLTIKVSGPLNAQAFYQSTFTI